MYERAAIDRLDTIFSGWYEGKVALPDGTTRMDMLSYNDCGMLRGRRAQVVPPPSFASKGIDIDVVVYHRHIVESHLSALKLLGIEGAPMLNFLSIIRSTRFSYDQAWHSDALYEDGLKVQVPLLEVTDELGPVEIKPTTHPKKCPVIRATTTLGDVIMYRHLTQHRGTRVRATSGAQRRTVLDISWMLPPTVGADDYLSRSKFTAAGVAAVRFFRERAARLCKADALPCTAPAEARSAMGGPPYGGPVPALEKAHEGFVGPPVSFVRECPRQEIPTQPTVNAHKKEEPIT